MFYYTVLFLNSSRIQPERQLSRRLSKPDIVETDKDTSANAQIAVDPSRTDISPKRT